MKAYAVKKDGNFQYENLIVEEDFLFIAPTREVAEADCLEDEYVVEVEIKQNEIPKEEITE